MPSPCPEEKGDLQWSQPFFSLDEILLKFAKHEELLGKVAADLVSQTARHQKVAAQLEGMVFAESFSKQTLSNQAPLAALEADVELPRSSSSARRSSFSRNFVDEPRDLPDRTGGRLNSVYKPTKKWWKSEDPEQTRGEGGASAKARISSFLSSFLSDAIMGSVIGLNIVVMVCQVQWQGYEAAFALGLRSDDGQWEDAEEVFELIEIVFISIYLIDVILRAMFLPWSRFHKRLELVDTFVVLVCALEAFILRPAGLADWDALVVLRLVRAFRILRVVRMFRFMKLFSNLHVLIETLGGMLVDLFWGTLLLLIIVIAGGLLMAVLAQPYITDENLEVTTRTFLYERFGHADSSFYYIFEAAMTSAWVNSAAPLIFDVNKLFAFVWIPFVVFVNFAMMRVIAALFLKETLDAAAKERERVAQDAAKKKDRMAQSLKNVFKLADDTGDGCVERESFLRMLEEEQVIETLGSMGLNHNEVRALVDLLSEGGHAIPIADFLHAALTMHETARTIHVMQTSADVARLEHELKVVGAKQDAILRRLGIAVATSPKAG